MKTLALAESRTCVPRNAHTMSKPSFYTDSQFNKLNINHKERNGYEYDYKSF